jgi:preprotein translocase subunit YajC
MSSLPVLFAQVTNAANAAAGTPANPVDATAQDRPGWFIFVFYGLVFALIYFMFFRPQIQAKKNQDEKIKTAKTGDKIVTSGGIHGVITNVKDSTVIVRVADSVKLEIEKGHIDKILRTSDSSDSDKTSDKTPAKAS